MKKRVNKTLIGLFVLGSLMLAIGFVVLFGSGKLFTEKRTCVMYFDGSIRGLSVGSPVAFRGIKIGSVTDILVRADTSDLSFTFPVFIEIELKRFTIEDQKVPFSSFFTTIDKLIEKGLRAQLQTASLVTGQLMVELDFHPDMPASIHGHDADYPEIPTIKDNINELTEKIEKIPVELFSARTLSIIERVDEALHSSNLNESIAHFSSIVADLNQISTQFENNIGPLSENAYLAFSEFRGIIKDLDTRTAILEKEILKTAQAATRTLDQTTQTLDQLSDTTNEDSVLMYQLGKTLEDMSAAAESIRSFAEYFEQHPEALIRGKSH